MASSKMASSNRIKIQTMRSLNSNRVIHPCQQLQSTSPPSPPLRLPTSPSFICFHGASMPWLTRPRAPLHNLFQHWLCRDSTTMRKAYIFRTHPTAWWWPTLVGRVQLFKTDWLILCTNSLAGQLNTNSKILPLKSEDIYYSIIYSRTQQF
jgi:hypothetical protein